MSYRSFYLGTAAALAPVGGKGLRHSIVAGIRAFCQKYGLAEDTMPFMRALPKAAHAMSTAGVSLDFIASLIMLMS